MSYHTSGSMSSYGGGYGGYGTIKIELAQSGDLSEGVGYEYKIIGGSEIHFATTERIQGRLFLIDNNFTIGENDPPFSAGMPMEIYVPGTSIPLMQSIITGIESVEHESAEPTPESMPTSPPSGFVADLIDMVGALSPEEQWIWDGLSWNPNTTTTSETSDSATDSSLDIPDDNRVPLTITVFDGSNLRMFHGMESIPINEFIVNNQNIPIVQIDELSSDRQTVATYSSTINNSTSTQDKFNLFTASDKNMSDTSNIITEIKGDVDYNIMIDAPNPIPDESMPGPEFNISYNGILPPPPPMYEEPPIVAIPASFPPAYQNSNNEGVEGLLTGRKCGNCIFFEAETGNCSRWNAIARDYYWCAAWQTMEPVIAQPNEFTSHINQTSNPQDELYNFFIQRVRDPISQEPNLTNFLSPLSPLHSTYGAYIYGDVLRRMVDSGNAFDFDNVELNFFFTNQDKFLNSIEFINNGGLSEFDVPQEQYDSVQQHLCMYNLTKKQSSTLPTDYPQSLKINLHGSFFGSPINILSQLDLTNAKIAYNPTIGSDNFRHILVDQRLVEYENIGRLHIDIIKPSIRERVIKFFDENSKDYNLDNVSSIQFKQWVADRSFTSEAWQNLYSYLLTISVLSSNDQHLIELIQNTLGEELINNPSTTIIPMTTQVLDPNTVDSTIDQGEVS